MKRRRGETYVVSLVGDEGSTTADKQSQDPPLSASVVLERRERSERSGKTAIAGTTASAEKKIFSNEISLPTIKNAALNRCSAAPENGTKGRAAEGGASRAPLPYGAAEQGSTPLSNTGVLITNRTPIFGVT